MESSTDSLNIINDLKRMRKALSLLFCGNACVIDLCVSEYDQSIQVEKQGIPASIFFCRDDVSEGEISVEASKDFSGCAKSMEASTDLSYCTESMEALAWMSSVYRSETCQSKS
jgi:hypothetical protein